MRIELSEAETELQRAVEARVQPLLQRQAQLAAEVEKIGDAVGTVYREALLAIRLSHPEVPESGFNFEARAPERGKGRSALVWTPAPAGVPAPGVPAATVEPPKPPRPLAADVRVLPGKQAKKGVRR
jgi:hypothetical protein